MSRHNARNLLPIDCDAIVRTSIVYMVVLYLCLWVCICVCVWKHVYTYFLWCIFSAILQRVCWQFPGTWFASITIYFFPFPPLSSTWVRKRQEAEKVYSFRCVYFVYYSFYYCFLFCVLPFALSEEVSRSNYFLELTVVVVGTRMWRTYVVHTHTHT